MMKRYHLTTSHLRHKVHLEQKTSTSDGAGGTTSIWEEVGIIWASISKKNGVERTVSGQLAASSTHVFRCRWRSDVSADMRLRFGSRVFNIRAIHNLDELGKIMEIHAEEGVAM